MESTDDLNLVDTYVGFADSNGFYGAIVVATDNPKVAMDRINQLGIHPKGKPLFLHVRSGSFPLEKLLNKEELESLGCIKGDRVKNDPQSLELVYLANLSALSRAR